MTRRPVPPRIPGVREARALPDAPSPHTPSPRTGRRISRRVAAAGIGAAALLPLGGMVAAALNGTSRAPDAAPTPARTTAPAPDASPSPTPDPPLFADVDASHPSREAVEWASEAGILPGREDGTFAPEETVSRAGLALALHRFAGAPETPLEDPVFTDLPDDPATAAALQWVGARGILWGDEDLAVRHGAPLTREDLATALMAAFAGGLAARDRAVSPQTSTVFADVDDEDPATLPLRWAVAIDALQRSEIAADGTPIANAMGPGDTLLVPQRGTTRAELAVALRAVQELLAA